MVKTYNKRSYNKKTRTNLSKSNTVQKFEREITSKFLEMLIMIKLYHWKTHSYATHKATDDLYSKLNEHMDHFIEVLLGKTDSRINFSNVKSLPVLDLSTPERVKNKVMDYKSYLVGLDKNSFIQQMSNSDLLNIRDEILADLNQFLYLLTFK
jgi:DNA-binding ferritin-like protein